MLPPRWRARVLRVRDSSVITEVERCTCDMRHAFTRCCAMRVTSRVYARYCVVAMRMVQVSRRDRARLCIAALRLPCRGDDTLLRYGPVSHAMPARRAFSAADTLIRQKMSCRHKACRCHFERAATPARFRLLRAYAYC